ncbi:hypothetical protein [Mycobacteroides abscessus]|uniref:hypothetical protein n=1 Tax=Mycobacteroides abscessus TaxID=36809 RepID=UPI0039F12D57
MSTTDQPCTQCATTDHRQVSVRDLRTAAWVLGEELARRRRHGVPIPIALRQAWEALQRSMSDNGHIPGHAETVGADLETVQQRAERLGVSARTVRRQALKSGQRKVGGRWIFDEREPPHG